MTRDHSRLPYIDAMRGCAIIMVILVHTSQAVAGLSPVARGLAWAGQMGVQLFFLASAYSLCFVQDQQRQDQNATLRFCVRRYFRIAPLYYVAIAFYGLIAVTSAPDGIWAHRSDYTGTAIAANTLLIHGFVERANNTIVPGGWSIGTEVAFYLLFPLLWNFVRRNKEECPRRAVFNRTLGLLFAALALSTLYAAWQSAHGAPVSNNSFAYFSIVNQLPVFLLGMLAYSLWPRRSDHARFPFGALLLLSLFAVISSVLVAAHAPFAFSVLPVTCGLAFMQLLRILRSLPEIRWLQAIGQQSYSLYIFHFVFAWHLSKAMGGMVGARIPADALWLILACVAIAGSYVIALVFGSPIEKLGIACGRIVAARLARTVRPASMADGARPLVAAGTSLAHARRRERPEIRRPLPRF